MALEDLLKGLIQAIEANTAALTQVVGSAPTATVNNTATETVKTTTKPPAETKPKGATLEDLVKLVTTYMKTGDKEQVERNKTNGKKVLTYLGADKFSTVPADKLEEAMQMVTALSEGRTPEQLAGSETAEDDLV